MNKWEKGSSFYEDSRYFMNIYSERLSEEKDMLDFITGSSEKFFEIYN